MTSGTEEMYGGHHEENYTAGGEVRCEHSGIDNNKRNKKGREKYQEYNL